jgi:flagellar protein FliS
MFAADHYGANAYSNIGVETGVMTSNPHQLVSMLFEGAQIALGMAVAHMRTGNIPGKGEAISKAIAIIENGLKASLDAKAGGEIAMQLDALYAYMSRRLLLANLRNEIEPVKEVSGLLAELHEAWRAVGQSPSSYPRIAGHGNM